jgi:hypothetical protein
MSIETKHPALQYMEDLRAERRRRGLEALDRKQEIHARILLRNGGQLIDVDDVLDETRGYKDWHSLRLTRRFCRTPSSRTSRRRAPPRHFAPHSTTPSKRCWRPPSSSSSLPPEEAGRSGKLEAQDAADIAAALILVPAIQAESTGADAIEGFRLAAPRTIGYVRRNGVRSRPATRHRVLGIGSPVRERNGDGAAAGRSLHRLSADVEHCIRRQAAYSSAH